MQPEVQARLGDKLKEVYSDILNAPVPDRFTELLAKLESSGPADGPASQGGRDDQGGHGGHGDRGGSRR